MKIKYIVSETSLFTSLQETHQKDIDSFLKENPDIFIANISSSICEKSGPRSTSTSYYVASTVINYQ